MDADADAVAKSKVDTTTHRLRITRMEAAGNISRSDKRKDLLVSGGRTFPEITIDINVAHASVSSRKPRAIQQPPAGGHRPCRSTTERANQFHLCAVSVKAVALDNSVGLEELMML